MKKNLLVLACLLTAIPAVAQTSYPVKRNVEVTSSAKRMVAPDKFYMQIVIRDNAGAGRKGIEQTEQGKLIPVLRKCGIDPKTQLTIRDFASDYTGKSKIVLTKSYELIVTDAQQVNRVIASLREAGISDIDITRAVYTGSAAVLDSLKGEAVRRARRNAGLIAEAAGDRVGDVLYVRYYDQNHDNYYRPVMMAKGMDAVTEENAFEPVLFREIELSVGMTVVFELTE